MSNNIEGKRLKIVNRASRTCRTIPKGLALMSSESKDRKGVWCRKQILRNNGLKLLEFLKRQRLTDSKSLANHQQDKTNKQKSLSRYITNYWTIKTKKKSWKQPEKSDTFPTEKQCTNGWSSHQKQWRPEGSRVFFTCCKKRTIDSEF